VHPVGLVLPACAQQNHVARRPHTGFDDEPARGQFEIVPRRAHQRGDGVAVEREHQRIFDSEIVGRLRRLGIGGYADDGTPRRRHRHLASVRRADTVSVMPSARDAVEEHLAAFNAHDSERLLAGFADDAIWATGQDVMRGRAALADLFDDSLWDLQPQLAVVSFVAGEQTVAAELREQITVAGARENFRIAVFFTVLDGLIVNAKVYREGVADIE
jgi:hypothetical protein